MVFAIHSLWHRVMNVGGVAKHKCAYARRGMAIQDLIQVSFITLRGYYGSYLVKDEEDGR